MRHFLLGRWKCNYKEGDLEPMLGQRGVGKSTLESRKLGMCPEEEDRKDRWTSNMEA